MFSKCYFISILSFNDQLLNAWLKEICRAQCSGRAVGNLLKIGDL